MSATADSLALPERTRHRRRSIAVLRWLRRIHLYVGLWGAVLGFGFGLTGIVMNHRAILPMKVEKQVQTTAQLPLPARPFDTPDAMAQWLQGELKFDALQTHVRTEPERKVRWGDREVQQPARWMFMFNSPHKSVGAEYFAGNRSVKVETRDSTPIGTLLRLHTATGANAFWVLLSDTIAGAFMLLCVTGLLLWTRLNPIRASAVCVALAALVGTVFFLWRAL